MERRLFLASVVLTPALCAAYVRGDKPPLRIATFQADITPPLGSPLCHGNVTPAKKIVSPLTARGIIFITDESPVVICAIDWVRLSNTGYDVWVDALAKAVGTSTDRVSVHCVHQHGAPGMDLGVEALLAQHDLSGKMFDVAFVRDAIARTAKAAAEALKSPRRVTHLGRGMAKVDKVASSRRCMGPDGRVKYKRMSSCRDEKMRAEPDGMIDPYLRTLSLWDGDEPLVAMSFYACHPCSYYGRGGVSADFVGIARAAREAALPGVAQIYFDGAGGNIACGKYNDGSAKVRPILAARLEQGMKTAWEATKKVPISAADVSWRSRAVRLPMRKNLDEAKSVRDLANKKLSTQKRMYAARFITWIRRVNSGRPIPLGCLRMGSAYVMLMPGELFVEYQLAAQKMRPDGFVLMAAYAAGGPGYICTKVAYGQGGYEDGWVSMVAPEAEDILLPAMQYLLDVENRPPVRPSDILPNL